MKKTYNTPVITLSIFINENIITTSDVFGKFTFSPAHTKAANALNASPDNTFTISL